eukprot:70429-Prorocentrum_minimum.AAC.1
MQIEEAAAHVRHYSGQWFKEGLPEDRKVAAPLPEAHLNAMKAFAPEAKALALEVYGSAKVLPTPAAAGATVGGPR